RDSMARIDKCQVSRQSRIPLLSGVAAGRPVSLEEIRYFSPVGEEYRLKSASSNSLKTLRPISSSSRAEEGWPRHQKDAAKPPLMERPGWCWLTTDYSFDQHHPVCPP